MEEREDIAMFGLTAGAELAVGELVELLPRIPGKTSTIGEVSTCSQSQPPALKPRRDGARKLMMREAWLAMAAALLVGSAAAAVAADRQGAPQNVRSGSPVCLQPSHDRLIIREGRDVCGGTLGSGGRPLASGYLPTACKNENQTYRIDAQGWADRCLRRPDNQKEN
jgi:hypothetical protein